MKGDKLSLATKHDFLSHNGQKYERKFNLAHGCPAACPLSWRSFEIRQFVAEVSLDALVHQEDLRNLVADSPEHRKTGHRELLFFSNRRYGTLNRHCDRR